MTNAITLVSQPYVNADGSGRVNVSVAVPSMAQNFSLDRYSAEKMALEILKKFTEEDLKLVLDTDDTARYDALTERLEKITAELERIRMEKIAREQGETANRNPE